MSTIAIERAVTVASGTERWAACDLAYLPDRDRTDSLTASPDVDALVLRAIAARLRDRALPRRLQRLADLDADRLIEIAGAIEQEYVR